MVLIKKFYSNSFFRVLANLKLAIGLLFIIGFVIALGTFIEQEQSLIYYQNNYPSTTPILGFIDWNFIFQFNLDHIYTAYWFILLLVLFGASLLSCTFTTQLPSLKKFRLWNFLRAPNQFNKLSQNIKIEDNLSNGVTYCLHESNFHIFRQGRTNYAYSGLLGRVGPIIVHASIIMLLIGSVWGLLGGYTIQQIIPRGEVFHLQNIIRSATSSYVPQDFSCRVNDFWITYTREFKINQFYSDLSIINGNGDEIKRKTIFVNEPFIYNGVTLYQTDWDILGLKLQLNGGSSYQLPLQKIVKSGRNFWFGSVVIDNNSSARFSILINDLRGSISIYNSQGILVKDCLIGDEVQLTESVALKFNDFISSTGLQIKSDPGISLVYMSFFFLMFSVYLSFISYSQVWQVEHSTNLMLGGKSNRAVLYFQQEFRKIVKSLQS
jgi:cytochrome c biogenesis protein